MSLQVNLILDSERRSGSSISPKFIIRTSLIVLGGLVVMGVFSLMLGARAARQNLAFIESEKEGMDTVYNSVIKTRGELKKLKTLAGFLEGWQTNRLNMCMFLRSLQLCVPESIQLTRLTLRKNLDFNDNAPHWSGNIYVRGRVTGRSADADVRALHLRLRGKPPFVVLLDQVQVKRFAAEESDTAGEVRIFDIEGNIIRRKIPLKR